MHNKPLKPKKGNSIIYIILIILVIIVMATLKRCASNVDESNGNDNPSQETINIAIEYSPLSLYTYDDTLGGFAYDVMRLIGNHFNKNIKFHPIVTLKNTMDDLMAGKYDMVIAQYPETKEDKDKYLFSEALYIDSQVLIQLKDSEGKTAVNNQLELAGDTVVIIKDSPMLQRIENLSHEIGDTIHVIVDENYGPEQLFLRVATGEVKYAVINKSIATQMAKKYPNVDCSTKISFSQFQSVILKKDEKALCDSLNNWIKEIKGTPQFKKLQSRYF